MSKGVELISIERERQISKEGWTPEHDLRHSEGELSQIAACYAMPEHTRCMYQSLNAKTGRWYPRWYPIGWPIDSWKPTPEDRVKELVKAGALIAAEIDRLLYKL